MKLRAPGAILLSLLPHSSRSFSFTTSAMVSSNRDEFSSQQRQDNYQPVHVYPYSADLSTIKQTGNYATIKRFHFVRHAEGFHNVNRAYRDIVNLDARLTEKGKQQCQSLAEKLLEAHSSSSVSHQSPLFNDNHYHQILKKTELVVSSPLTRCMQTAILCFPPLLADKTTKENNDETTATTSNSRSVPFVAHESIRETVNYACDRRRPISEMESHFHDHFCFREIDHDHDEIWESYIRRLGCTEEWNSHRESAELHVVAERAKNFFQWVQETRPEQEIVVCTHSAFLRCFLSWGQTGGVPSLMKQTLDDRGNVDEEMPVLKYCGDSSFEEYMRGDYENCELRSFVAAFPHGT